MTELLELLLGHVSFSLIVPVNSSLNVSVMTSVEGMELALIATEAVQIRPIMWEDRPKRSVSRDITESLGMMKYWEVSWSSGRFRGTILPSTIFISVLLLWSTTGIINVLVSIWSLQLDDELDMGERVVTSVDNSAEIRVLRFTSALVSPMSFSKLTSLMAVQYSSAKGDEYLSLSFLDER